MKKFYVGDRVSVYGYDSNGCYNQGKFGKHYGVVIRSAYNSLVIEWDDKSFKKSDVSPNQCRSLKKKNKKSKSQK